MAARDEFLLAATAQNLRKLADSGTRTKAGLTADCAADLTGRQPRGPSRFGLLPDFFNRIRQLRTSRPIQFLTGSDRYRGFRVSNFAQTPPSVGVDAVENSRSIPALSFSHGWGFLRQEAHLAMPI